MDKSDMKTEENKELKDSLIKTTLKADEKLKYRIMNQIQTESALSRSPYRNSNSIPNLLRNIGTIFGIMYLLILLTGAALYLHMGTTAIFSPLFYIPIIFISFASMLYLTITYVDEERLSKRKSAPSQKKRLK